MDPIEMPAKITKSKRAKDASSNTGRWTKEEHVKFLEGLAQFGREWKRVADSIPSRTVVQIRTHAQKYFQKIAKEKGLEITDPIFKSQDFAKRVAAEDVKAIRAKRGRILAGDEFVSNKRVAVEKLGNTKAPMINSPMSRPLPGGVERDGLTPTVPDDYSNTTGLDIPTGDFVRGRGRSPSVAEDNYGSVLDSVGPLSLRVDVSDVREPPTPRTMAAAMSLVRSKVVGNLEDGHNTPRTRETAQWLADMHHTDFWAYSSTAPREEPKSAPTKQEKRKSSTKSKSSLPTVLEDEEEQHSEETVMPANSPFSPTTSGPSSSTSGGTSRFKVTQPPPRGTSANGQGGAKAASGRRSAHSDPGLSPPPMVPSPGSSTRPRPAGATSPLAPHAVPRSASSNPPASAPVSKSLSSRAQAKPAGTGFASGSSTGYAPAHVTTTASTAKPATQGSFSSTGTQSSRWGASGSSPVPPAAKPSIPQVSAGSSSAPAAKPAMGNSPRATAVPLQRPEPPFGATHGNPPPLDKSRYSPTPSHPN